MFERVLVLCDINFCILGVCFLIGNCWRFLVLLLLFNFIGINFWLEVCVVGICGLYGVNGICDLLLFMVEGVFRGIVWVEGNLNGWLVFFEFYWWEMNFEYKKGYKFEIL